MAKRIAFAKPKKGNQAVEKLAREANVIDLCDVKDATAKEDLEQMIPKAISDRDTRCANARATLVRKLEDMRFWIGSANGVLYVIDLLKQVTDDIVDDVIYEAGQIVIEHINMINNVLNAIEKHDIWDKDGILMDIDCSLETLWQDAVKEQKLDPVIIASESIRLKELEVYDTALTDIKDFYDSATEEIEKMQEELKNVDQDS